MGPLNRALQLYPFYLMAKVANDPGRISHSSSEISIRRQDNRVIGSEMRRETTRSRRPCRVWRRVS